MKYLAGIAALLISQGAIVAPGYAQSLNDVQRSCARGAGSQVVADYLSRVTGEERERLAVELVVVLTDQADRIGASRAGVAKCISIVATLIKDPTQAARIVSIAQAVTDDNEIGTSSIAGPQSSSAD